MEYLSYSKRRKMLPDAMKAYGELCASQIPVGSLCIVNHTPITTKVYRVIKHYPVGSRIRGRKLNKNYEIQVHSVLALSFSSPKVKTTKRKSGMTSFQAFDLKPFDIIPACMLRSQLDDLLRSAIRG